MLQDFWADIDSALEARQRARVFDPNAYPLSGNHSECDHANNFCGLTINNYYQ